MTEDLVQHYANPVEVKRKTLFGKVLNSSDPLLSLLDEAVWLVAGATRDNVRGVVITDQEFDELREDILRRWRAERASSFGEATAQEDA